MAHWTQHISAAIVTGDARSYLERQHGLKGEARTPSDVRAACTAVAAAAAAASEPAARRDRPPRHDRPTR